MQTVIAIVLNVSYINTYLVSQFPAQKHSAALRHLHCPQHPFLHPHRSYLQASVTSGKYVQKTSHFRVSFLVHPKTDGEGISGAAMQDCDQ